MTYYEKINGTLYETTREDALDHIPPGDLRALEGAATQFPDRAPLFHQCADGRLIGCKP